MDRVVFRRFKEDSPGNINSYMHVGQHGEASWPGIIGMTEAVDPDTDTDTDVKYLLKELVQDGYKPVVRRRVTGFRCGRRK